MSRPRKIGLEYFPLDTTMDENFEAIEELHGNDGFTWMLKFWQAAYKTNDGIVDLSGIHGVIGAKKSRISVDKQNEIIKDAIDLKLLYEISPQKYTSTGIQARLRRVSDEREYDRKYSKNELSDRKPTDNDPIKGEKEKEKEIKENRKKKIKTFIPPTFEEFNLYCKENGYSSIAKKSFEYYSTADWHDSSGKKIANWKQKLIAVWFKNENKDHEPKKQLPELTIIQQRVIKKLGTDYDYPDTEDRDAWILLHDQHCE